MGSLDMNIMLDLCVGRFNKDGIVFKKMKLSRFYDKYKLIVSGKDDIIIYIDPWDSKGMMDNYRSEVEKNELLVALDGGCVKTTVRRRM